MSAGNEDRSAAQPLAVEDRELVVTVHARYPLAEIVKEYAEAITPDGGFAGTLNAWIEDNARGFIADMSPPCCTVESEWQLRRVSS